MSVFACGHWELGCSGPQEASLNCSPPQNHGDVRISSLIRKTAVFSLKRDSRVFLLVLRTGSVCSGLQQTFVDLSAPGETLLNHGHSGTGQEEDPESGEADG